MIGKERLSCSQRSQPNSRPPEADPRRLSLAPRTGSLLSPQLAEERRSFNARRSHRLRKLNVQAPKFPRNGKLEPEPRARRSPGRAWAGTSRGPKSTSGSRSVPRSPRLKPAPRPRGWASPAQSCGSQSAEDPEAGGAERAPRSFGRLRSPRSARRRPRAEEETPRGADGRGGRGRAAERCGAG